MTEGILIFAFNNEEVNYAKIAYVSATYAKKNLHRPVSLITDNETKNSLLNEYPNATDLFDCIIEVETTLSQTQYKRYHDGPDYKSLMFNNYSRANAYDLTPYDKTLVIDCDLLILNDRLALVWQSNENFMMSHKHYDLFIDRSYSEFNHISDYSIEFYWATVFYFVKTQENKTFFDLCKHIIDNYVFYRFVYRIDNPMMRNDFVFSIAQHIMNGFQNRSKPTQLPANINYVLDQDDIIEIKDSKTIVFLVRKKKLLNEYILVKTNNKNVHIMNKWAFLRNADRLLEVIKNV
jgi:hypothetical protein